MQEMLTTVPLSFILPKVSLNSLGLEEGKIEFDLRRQRRKQTTTNCLECPHGKRVEALER